MGQTPSHPTHDGSNRLPEDSAAENNDSMLAQSGIPATRTQDSRKGSSSPGEVRRSRKEDKSKRKRKSSSTRGHPPESPSSSSNDATETRPWKRKRTDEDVQNEDKENSYGVEQRKATKNGPTKVPKPVIEVQQTPQQSPEQAPRQTPIQTPKQKPIKTPVQTPDSAKTSRAHSSAKKQTLTGFFTAAEVQQLEHFKLDFCNTNGLSGDAFDEMVQHSERDKSREFPCDASIVSKPEFWRNIYESMPQRDRRSVYRFMRRHFQASTQKPHEWTREQDDELVSLHSQHGPKWAYIAKLIGRSDDDVVQRWKNRLEHRNTMLRGPWSAEEVRELQNALNRSWKAMRDSGVEVGRDIYEMEESLVGWGQVSERMQHKRSRQQCADKWRRIRRRILYLRERGNADATYEPTTEMKSPKKSRTPITVAQEVPKEKRYKSSEYVEDEDEDEDEEPERPVEVKPESESEPNPGPAEESESDSDTGEPEPDQAKPAVTQSPSKRSPGNSSGSDSESESDEPAPRKRSRSAESAEIQKSPISVSGSGSGSGVESISEDEEPKPKEGNADGDSDNRMSLDPLKPADSDETKADEWESQRDEDGDVDMGKTALNTVEDGVQNQESGSESESKSGSEPTGSEPEVQSDDHIQKPASESSDSESDSDSSDSESDSGPVAEPATVQKPASQSDSGSDSGSEAEPEPATAQKPANQSDSNSESESGSESEAKEAKAVPQKPEQASSDSEDTSDSDSESESESDSSDSASSRSRSQSLDSQPSRASPRTSSKASTRASPKKATPESDSESTSSGSDSTSSGSDSDSNSESESEDESDRVKQESRSGSENTFRFIKAEDVDSD